MKYLGSPAKLVGKADMSADSQQWGKG